MSSAPRARWLWYVGSSGLLSLVIFAGADPAAPPPPAAPAAPQPTTLAAASVAAVHPLDEPLRLLTRARDSFAGVQDYSCTLIKRELLNGQMSPDNVIAMKVRHEPFSVYLRWLEPKAMVGQEACFVAGKHEGKMRVKSAGLLGAVGFISLDPRDERARKTSRHTITEAGIGNLLKRYQASWDAERQMNLTQVRIAEYEFNKRRCTRVETLRPTNPNGKFAYHRSVVYFDRESNLPIRVECYDWPRRPGEAGELVEVYSYLNLKLNVGLTDDVFNH
jgi:hypothetical protein